MTDQTDQQGQTGPQTFAQDAIVTGKAGVETSTTWAEAEVTIGEKAAQGWWSRLWAWLRDL